MTGAYCASRIASPVSARICGSASMPWRTSRALKNCGAAKKRRAAVSSDPINPPAIAAVNGDDAFCSLTDLLVLVPVSLVFLTELCARDHRDILRAKPVGRAGG